MAKINKGILGGFSGKVGTVIGYNWRGQEMIRALPKKSTKTPTDLQVKQRAKFTIAMVFLSPIRWFLELYFLRSRGLKSRFNLAMGYTLQNAIMPDMDGNFVIDYSKVLISSGQLRGMDDAMVAPKPDTKLEFVWRDNSGQGNATVTDKFSGIGYCEEIDSYHFFEGIAERGDESVEIALPAEFSGKSMHLWVSFISDSGKMASISNYLGEVTNT